MIIISKEEIIQRLLKKFPNEPFELIEYTRVTKPATIKCLKCGEIKTHSSMANLSNSKHICSCYSLTNHLTVHNQNKQKLIEIFNKHGYLDLVSFGYRSDILKYVATIRCNKCNSMFTTSWQVLLKHQLCPYCDEHHQLNNNVIAQKLGSDFILMDDYQGYDNNLRLKHKCGLNGFQVHIIYFHNIFEAAQNVILENIAKAKKELVNI